MKSTKSLYELLSEYSQKEITIAIEKLDDYDKKILSKKYNEGLDKSSTLQSISQEENKYFYTSILPKIRRYLKNPSSKPRKKSSTKTAKQQTSTNMSVTLEDKKTQDPNQAESQTAIEKISETEEQIVETSTKIEPQTIELSTNTEEVAEEQKLPYSYEYTNNINQSENMWTTNLENTYQLILGMLSSFSFQELAQNLGMKDAFIISLRLGIDTTDGYCYSIEEIANFLKIPKEEVIKSTNNILELCKKSLNQTIDMAIKVTQGNARVLKQNQPKSIK